MVFQIVTSREEMMMDHDDQEMFQCQAGTTCAFVYNPKRGDRKGKIPQGTSFRDLPEEWMCPGCGATKEKFRSMGKPDASEGK